MAYLVKRIKDIKDRKEDGEEKMYYIATLSDKEADESIVMKLSKQPSFVPGDIMSPGVKLGSLDDFITMLSSASLSDSVEI